ncbi:MAG: isoleucine--tRNA ligase, partial [Candidatus Omnitrophica bacterium]|nr:isoleucine--tRNA ligase [Candidatus Omnitrophota bacterium]
MYKKVDKFPDMPVLENRMLEFWDKEQVFNKLRQQNKGGQKWSFLDGPITANNPMGVHHAWGRALKDIFQRYHAMQGCELRYQNGFDCQGLWVEVEVEKELGFETKKDILKFGLDKFVEACKERVRKYSAIQTRQSVRLGYWMDWDNSYYTMADENNYTIWGFLKKCHQREFVYKGADVMPWCPRCGVGLSQMEMHEGYKQVCHKAAFVRFKLKDKDNEYLLVWTTTPWTLTSNVSAAVGPELEYLKVKSKKDNAVYYAAEGCFDFQRLEEEHKSKDWPKEVAKLKTIKQIFEEQGGSEIIGRLKGKDMEGWTYVGPFDELPAQNNIGGYPKVDKQLSHKSLNGVNCHKVVLWKDVAEGEGTGIVHIAPGCGAEDFQLGQEIGLVAIAPLDEEGNYLDGFDWLTGRNAGDPELAKEICKNLEQKGVLFAAEQYPHSYPHCWRCNTELVYRFVDEWFINMSWREEIKKVAQKICWIPDWGKDRELEWLTNMRDWMISKKRFWGLALPIWECDQEDCSWFEVIGGYDELKERAVKGWDKFEGHSPHRPWIDEVKIKCAKCGSQASRIEDVGNPWLDAGIVPYSTVNYKTDPDYWKEWIPADLVLECFPGQFRNWFYALLAMSTMMENVPPFKTLLGHALVKDEQGRDMHKSLGNSIDFETASNKVGAEILRYIYASWNPANNLLFGWDMAKEYNRRIMTLWNTYSFYITYAQADNFNPSEFKLDVSKRTILDKWILSRTHRLVKNARVYYDNYELHRHIKEFEEYLEDLSNWYLRRSRRRF